MAAAKEFIELYPTYSRTKKERASHGKPNFFLGLRELTDLNPASPGSPALMRTLRIG
jgi:hypothetical protein